MRDDNIEYRFSVKPLSAEDGGGFSIEFPDLPGCISDGDTVEEAIANGKDAVKSWLTTCKKLGRKAPKPNQKISYSGKTLIRLPKYLHKNLSDRAELEGVSLNSLVQSFIAEGLGRKDNTDRL
ncbi:MAG: type II toxin-antitoxin system HicB family antitoxin [Rickettsiales bacterium]